MRVELQPAFLLHSRKISDSRLLVDFLTRDYGVIGAIARAPSKKKASYAVFSPALISWVGAKPLKTLIDYELAHYAPSALFGNALYCGFYLNELLQRLMPKGEACTSIYSAYQKTLNRLGDISRTETGEAVLLQIEPLLRELELLVLEEQGYLVDFNADANTGEPLKKDKYYYLDIHSGFSEVGIPTWPVFDGAAIAAMAERNFTDSAHRGAMKRMMRILLLPLLGGKPLKSRELFSAALAHN